MVTTPLKLASHPTHVVLGIGCTRSIGSRAATKGFPKHSRHHGSTMEFWRCNQSLVVANSKIETCVECCILHFPTAPPCSTKVDVLETGGVPISFLPLSDEKFGYDYRT